MVSLPEDLAQAVEDYRFANRISTEAEAIRRLIEAGLNVGEFRSPTSPGSSGSGGSSKHVADKLSPTSRPRKPAPERKSEPSRSKLDQIRALREGGFGDTTEP